MEGEECLKTVEDDLALRRGYKRLLGLTDASERADRDGCRVDIDINQLLKTLDICSLSPRIAR